MSKFFEVHQVVADTSLLFFIYSGKITLSGQCPLAAIRGGIPSSFCTIRLKNSLGISILKDCSSRIFWTNQHYCRIFWTQPCVSVPHPCPLTPRVSPSVAGDISLNVNLKECLEIPFALEAQNFPRYRLHPHFSFTFVKYRLSFPFISPTGCFDLFFSIFAWRYCMRSLCTLGQKDADTRILSCMRTEDNSPSVTSITRMMLRGIQVLDRRSFGLGMQVGSNRDILKEESWMMS